MTKICSVCGDPVGPRNKSGMCKKCRTKKYREDNRDKIRTYKKQYHIDNKEKIRAYVSQWQKDNPEKVNAYNKKWQQANPDKFMDSIRRWQRANSEKEKARQKARRKDDPESGRSNLREWRKANPARAREYQHERREYLSAYIDCEKLNTPFQGCDAHHLNPNTIIHIPTGMHNSVYHSIKTGQGMEKINRLAYNWLNGVRAESLQTTFDVF